MPKPLDGTVPLVSTPSQLALAPQATTRLPPNAKEKPTSRAASAIERCGAINYRHPEAGYRYPVVEALQFADLIADLLEIAAQATPHPVRLGNQHFPVNPSAAARLTSQLDEPVLHMMGHAFELLERADQSPALEIFVSVLASSVTEINRQLSE